MGARRASGASTYWPSKLRVAGSSPAAPTNSSFVSTLSSTPLSSEPELSISPEVHSGPRLDPEPPLVFGFGRPHRPGSICGNPCEQCGGKTMVTLAATKLEGRQVPAFLIVREATHQEYVDSVLARGGKKFQLTKPGERYFYVVETD